VDVEEVAILYEIELKTLTATMRILNVVLAASDFGSLEACLKY
jgi:hypothetical protein